MSDKTQTATTGTPAQNIIDMIAKKHLGIETLEQRFSDSLDFHDCGVLSIKAALETAFKLGVEAGMSINQKGDVR